MLATVSFNPYELVKAMTAPRFSQPWTRPQYGDAMSLLYETSMMLYLVPPVAGLIMARWRSYGWPVLMFSGLAAAFTVFYGVSTGTRNMTIIHGVGFIAALALATPGKMKLGTYMAVAVSAAALVAASQFMLAARSTGLAGYFESRTIANLESNSEFFVDYNIWAIGTLTSHFPRSHDYLWLEIPLIALAKPIPRAVWPGKPSEPSVSLEQLAGVDGMMTMSSSFVGEGYMSLGIAGVLIFGFFVAAAARWWTDLTAGARSEFGVVVYSAGLYGLLIYMRSPSWVFTGMLPAVAALLLCYFLSSSKAKDH